MGAHKALSRPTFQGFSPDPIQWQREVVDLIDTWDYTTGTPEILLSGAYGSAKSTLLAHLAVRHCLEHAGARVAICRKARDDVKKTIWSEILDHIAFDPETGEGLTEGRMHKRKVQSGDYALNESELKITFANGSEIVAAFWGDGRYTKFRSWKLSMLLIEEIAENDEDDEEAFKQLKARLRRLPHVPQNICIAATNPDSPTHWVYRYFIEPNMGGQHPTRFVFYSTADQNPFLDVVYTRQLRADMSPREAARYLDGKWIELFLEVIYYEYRSPEQYKGRSGASWKVTPLLPIGLAFDFNIGHGKPMSAIQFQYDHPTDTFHFFNEVIVEGARTADVMDEWQERGDLPRFLPGVDGEPRAVRYVITGDAAGKHRDTRNTRMDYDIVKEGIARAGIPAESVDFQVPSANPSLRKRHVRTNSYCKSGDGRVRLYLWQRTKKADEGLRLVKLRKGADYTEDDSKDYQHVTTAIGYAIMSTIARTQQKSQGTVYL